METKRDQEHAAEELVWQDTPDIKKPFLRIDEKPQRWWESLLYGWQHTLVDISPFVLPLAVAGAIGIPIYARYGLGDAWLVGLPVFMRLLLTNTVVLAILLNIFLNMILGGDDVK